MSLTDRERITIDRRIDDRSNDDSRGELRRALTAEPRRIPTRLFYDDRGSELFERICEQPEYYPTRAEREILETRAPEIVAASGAEELVELGSGAATKTVVLLDAMERAGQLRLYVPFDISDAMVERVAQEMAERYPGVEVHGVVGDFISHLGRIPEGGRRLAAFLGGTIGNFLPSKGREFLARVARQLSAGDHLLLGTDLIKDRATLEAAYDDAAGVTAEFNLNVLRVVNDLTGGDFEIEGFRHVALWNPRHHRIEMHLESKRPQAVRLPSLDLEIELAPGERILTEISTKYDRGKVEALVEGAGFELVEWYTDQAGRFALSLSRRL